LDKNTEKKIFREREMREKRERMRGIILALLFHLLKLNSIKTEYA